MLSPLAISRALVLLVAVEHFYILVLEVFFWNTSRTRTVFGLSPEFAESTQAMAANQGLYNGFLAAGLLWGVFHSRKSFGQELQLFFLICVIIAAIFGSLTIKYSIILLQGLPALAAFLMVLVGRRVAKKR